MKTAVFLATRREADEALGCREFGFVQIRPDVFADFEVWENDTRYVFISGVGLVNAAACFAWAAKNYDFDFSINVGAAGDVGSGLNFGDFALIEKSVCLEPYNPKKIVFDISKFGDFGALAKFRKSLGSASRPVVSEKARAAAGRVCELVDMEGYAFARAAEALGKNIALLKFVSDFSPSCDIPKNIEALRSKMNDLKSLWI